MGLTHLLPPSTRRRLRRLRQDVTDIATALTTERRPVARTGALTDPGVYATAARSPRFGSPVAPEAPRTKGQPGRVLFADHGVEVVVREDQTILQAGLEAGLDLDFSCTVGGCAACALQIVDGEVVYDGPNCLTDAERERGMCLACVGRPNGKITVESL